ncbi:MAG: trigger factor [Candidatus Aminicenantes bacterium]|nr:trigger factor [Candidatus Aminicenantes bacterium]
MTTDNEENNKTEAAAKPKRTRARAKAKPEPGTAESMETTETTAAVEAAKKSGTGTAPAPEAETQENQLIVEFTIEIKKEEIEKKFNETLDKYAAEIKLPGFRAGKAPMEVVRNRLKDAVSEEVVNQMLSEAVMEKINKEKMRVISKPIVKKLEHEEGKDLRAEMAMEVLPEIELPDLETLEIEIPVKDLEHEPFDEQKTIDRLLESHMRQVPVTDRGIKGNDMVMLKYQSKILATKRMDRIKSNYYLAMKKDAFEILDLYDEIVGKNIHDRLTVKRTYPADYQKKIWAGKEVEHYIEIEKIFEMVKPNLDEKFLKARGVNDEAELKQRLKEEHEEHSKMHREEKKTGFIIDKLSEAINFPLPHALVEEEMTRMIQQNPYQFTFNHHDENERKKVVETLKASAEKSVRSSLIIETVKEKYNLKVTSEDLENQYKSIAATNHLEFKEVRNYYMKPENKDYLEESLISSKVVDLLKEKIKIKEV